MSDSIERISKHVGQQRNNESLDIDATDYMRRDASGNIEMLDLDGIATEVVDGELTLQVGSTRTPIGDNTLAAMVQRSGGPARVDSYEDSAGSIAARVRALGLRAAVGVPIIVDGRVWGLAAVGSVQPGPMPADTEARISRFAELIATALVAGYRDEQKRQLLAEGSQRSNLIDALLEGRAFDDWSLWEVAGPLRLPINGPFVVIAAPIPTVGDEPLPEIESKLRNRNCACSLIRQGANESRPARYR